MIRFFERLKWAQNVLAAGCDGGFNGREICGSHYERLYFAGFAACIMFGAVATRAADIAGKPGSESTTLAASQIVLPLDIENGIWLIVSYFDGHRLVPVRRKAATDVRDPWMEFVEGRVIGSLACGISIEGYWTSSGRLRFWSNSVLGGWCPNIEFKETKGGFFDVRWPGIEMTSAFRGQRSITQRGRELVLQDDSGVVQAVLVPQMAGR